MDELVSLFTRGSGQEVLHATLRSRPNHSDQWGQTLHDAWTLTGRGAPIEMASQALDLPPACPADWNADLEVTPSDVAGFVADWFFCLQSGSPSTDLDVSGRADPADVAYFVSTWFAALSSGC